MWEIYQRDGRGVAICTTWVELMTSSTAERKIYGGRITYADYESTFIPEGNHFSAFMYKRQSFGHEREVRLLFQLVRSASSSACWAVMSSSVTVPCVLADGNKGGFAVLEGFDVVSRGVSPCLADTAASA
jgi:hypothetical protein